MTINRTKIDFALARKGWTMGNFAEACELSRGRLHAILNAKHIMPQTAGRLAAALGIDVAEIVDMDE